MSKALNPDLVTGNKMIDEQHSELIDKIDKLVDCCKQSGGKVEAIKMLDYLSDYTDFHFTEEEKLQEEVNYPGIQEHKQRHAEFKKAVEELHEMLVEQEGPTYEFVQAVNKNVTDWLFNHIKGCDKALVSFIQSK